MDEYYKKAVDNKTLQDAISNLDRAQKQNYETNEEHRNILSKFYDNIALYSAGAISFSTTIVGLVLANYPASLAQKLLFFPNVYYLYVCWLAFGTAFITVLLSKKFYAYYLSAFGFTHYTEKYKEFEEVKGEFFATNKDDILFTRGGVYEQQLQVNKDNIEKLKNAHAHNKKSSTRYWKWSRLCQNIAQVAATLGIVFLLLFSMLLTQSVVFGTAKTTNKSEATQTVKSSTLQLEAKPIIASGINDQEKAQIQKTVNTFESYLYSKNVNGALSMFTPPANKDEQSELDFLLGKDLAPDATKPLPRLFSTQGYNYTISGHMVREIRKSDGNIRVAVDELRTIYSGGEIVGYITKISNLILELKPVESSYQIAKYYHADTVQNDKIKYEGFTAQ